MTDNNHIATPPNNTGFNINPEVLYIISNQKKSDVTILNKNNNEEKHNPSKASIEQTNSKNKNKSQYDNDNDNRVFTQILALSNERRINASALTIAVKSDRNVGAMCRTCEIMGMRNYITLGDNHIDMRSAVGSHNYLNFEKYKCDIENKNEVNTMFDSCMTKYNMVPVFVEQGGVLLSKVDWKNYADKHICFILGSEDNGVPQTILNQKDRYPGSIIVSIEQQGVMRSLNVSIACGIILYEYNKFYREFINQHL